MKYAIILKWYNCTCLWLADTNMTYRQELCANSAIYTHCTIASLVITTEQNGDCKENCIYYANRSFRLLFWKFLHGIILVCYSWLLFQDTLDCALVGEYNVMHIGMRILEVQS